MNLVKNLLNHVNHGMSKGSFRAGTVLLVPERSDPVTRRCGQGDPRQPQGTRSTRVGFVRQDPAENEQKCCALDKPAKGETERTELTLCVCRDAFPEESGSGFPKTR